MHLVAFTGDIVDSSALDAEALNGVMSAIRAAARNMSKWKHPEVDRTDSAFLKRNNFARRGGDSWQVTLNRPEFALRAALFLRASVRLAHPTAQTRVAVATGEGTLPERVEDDLNSAHGPVFTGSGRMLAELSGRILMSHAQGGAMAAAFILADHISQNWSEAQARSLCAMLPPGAGPRKHAAETLGISRQAVDQALHAAGFPALEAAMAELEVA